MASSNMTLHSLTGQLISLISPHLTDDGHRYDRIFRELRNDEHGGTRKEWYDVQGNLIGYDLAELWEKWLS